MNPPFHLNKIGDVHFLLHNLSVQIIPFKLKSDGKTDTAKSQCRKQLLEDANYDLAKKDSRNVFSQCQLEIVC